MSDGKQDDWWNELVAPEDLQRWADLTRAALMRTNPQLERPIERDMAIAEWVTACGTAMPALIANVRQLTQRAEAAEAQLAQMQREIAGLRYYIGQLERNVTPELREYAAQVAQMMLIEVQP